MRVAILTCPHCDESWNVPGADADELREECRDCGAALNVEWAEVA